MTGEKAGLTISTESLCLISGVFIGLLSILANPKSFGQAINGDFFICFTIGAVGFLIIYSIRRAAEKIVTQLKKEE